MHIILSRKWLFGLLSLATGAGFFRNVSEATVLRAARTRDREAFERLVKQNAVALRRFAARRLPSADVEDVLQDTWIAVWERLPSLDEQSRFRAWIFTICYHKIQDCWRKGHSWRVRDADSGAAVEASYVPREFAQVELNECLAAFWSACPIEQREVLRMYYGDSLTLNEIGQILGRNLNTVKYQFYRAHELAANKLPDSEVLLREVYL